MVKLRNVLKCRAGSKEYIAKSILFCFDYSPDGNVQLILLVGSDNA